MFLTFLTLTAMNRAKARYAMTSTYIDAKIMLPPLYSIHRGPSWYILIGINYELLQWLDNYYALYISTSYLAVDTFFFMSGFLLAFQYLKHKAKPLLNQVISVPQMYLHRYLRYYLLYLTITFY